ncbi:hypothetical protein K504DRAFT_49386 [Pleomassaria siparia CBS 279.74]|uniref:Secreted protein n=1 Tax=Pleomassaria siparia CBS 279.74 TaxID=1314801 RepID=A0A6G1K2U1_9PLEO|nr:hypothetical protein K504DRAFT_49386 [Pleomassaria siparia CBS 279.74]
MYIHSCLLVRASFFLGNLACIYVCRGRNVHCINCRRRKYQVSRTVSKENRKEKKKEKASKTNERHHPCRGGGLGETKREREREGCRASSHHKRSISIGIGIGRHG